MIKRIPTVKSKEILVIEEDTIVDGNIESDVQIELKNGASLQVLGSILEKVTIKETLNTTVRGNEIPPKRRDTYMVDPNTGKTIFISRDMKRASLLVKGNIGQNSNIHIEGSLNVDGTIFNNVNIKTGETISCQKVGEKSVLKSSGDLTCGIVSDGSSLTTSFESINAQAIGSSCKIKASRNITCNNIGKTSTLKAGRIITCEQVGESSSVTSEFGTIETHEIGNLCKLKASRSITCKKIAEGSHQEEWFSIGSSCEFTAGENISCLNVGISSELKSEFGSILVNGHVNTQAKLNASREIQFKSCSPDAKLTASKIIDLSKGNLQANVASSSSSNNPISSPSLQHNVTGPGFSYSVERGTVVAQSTPHSVSITVLAGSDPISIGNIHVVSSNQRPAMQSRTTSEEKKSFPSSDVRRNRFLAAYDQRQQTNPNSTDNTTTHTTTSSRPTLTRRT